MERKIHEHDQSIFERVVEMTDRRMDGRTDKQSMLATHIICLKIETLIFSRSG